MIRMQQTRRNTAAAVALAALLGSGSLAATPAFAGSDILSHGTFTGATNHVTTGGVSIVKTASGHVVLLEPDFSLDGAPDPRVGLGKDGTYDDASDLGELTMKDGLQVYTVPASVDLSKYNEVYIWCRKFSVPLGVASLK
ncbi:MAG: DM13 domain-containing protein [Pseudomonadota bacterium]